MSDAQVMTDRIRGSLYGLLIGDALGCPVEGWSPGKIMRRYGVLAMMEEGKGYGVRPLGLHSDDGQQAVALCDAILENPDNPVPGYARTLVELYTDGPSDYGLFGHHRGTGSNFRKTVESLADGADLEDVSMPSSGNGNAMLIAPAAWYWRDDIGTLASRILDISHLKQHHPCGVASAAAVALIVVHGLQHGTLQTLEFTDLLAYVREVEAKSYEQLLARELVKAREPDTTFSSALQRALGLFDHRRRDALRGFAKIANETADRRVFATSGYAVASVITSIYMALTARSLFDGILDTVNLGGDADTTGAMVGAMVGAAFGYDTVPNEWLDDLQARGVFDDRVAPMVRQARGWKPDKSLVASEREWTERLILPEAKKQPQRPRFIIPNLPGGWSRGDPLPGRGRATQRDATGDEGTAQVKLELERAWGMNPPGGAVGDLDMGARPRPSAPGGELDMGAGGLPLTPGYPDEPWDEDDDELPEDEWEGDVTGDDFEDEDEAGADVDESPAPAPVDDGDETDDAAPVVVAVAPSEPALASEEVRSPEPAFVEVGESAPSEPEPEAAVEDAGTDEPAPAASPAEVVVTGAEESAPVAPSAGGVSTELPSSVEQSTVRSDQLTLFPSGD